MEDERVYTAGIVKLVVLSLARHLSPEVHMQCAAHRGLLVSLLAAALVGIRSVRVSKDDLDSVLLDERREEKIDDWHEAQQQRHAIHDKARFEQMHQAVHVEDPVEDPDEPPQFVAYTFHPGDTGFSVNRFDGRVECVSFEGQAYNQGLQNGWWLHKVGSFYPYSEWRLASYVNGTGSYSLVFSNKKVAVQCVNLPMNWKDSQGRTCDQYAQQDLCTPHGTQGLGWPTCGRWSLFCTNRDIHYYRARQADALSACCQCGGGWDPEGPTTSILTTAASTLPVTSTSSITSTTTTTTTSTTETTAPPTTTRIAGKNSGMRAFQLSSLAGLLMVVATVPQML